MFSELQLLLDGLAGELGAPVALEDPHQRLVAHSSQNQPVDALRTDSILRRQTPREIMDLYRQFDIAQASHPFRIPRYPEFEMMGRLCAPIRYKGHLLGFLWLIDDEQRLDPACCPDVERTAKQIALIMYEEELSQRLASGVLSNLLSPLEDLREAAARQLLDEGRLSAGGSSVTVVVVKPLPAESPGPEVEQGISEALWELGRGPSSGQALRLARADHGILLLPVTTAQREDGALAVGRKARDAVAHKLRAHGGMRVVAGIGEPQPGLAEAVTSYRQAQLAAKVAAVVSGLGDTLEWDKLGAFRVLVQLSSDKAVDLSLDPRLVALFAHGDVTVAETLETYLDLGCDAKLTAERLHLHRATLYYRLKKVEQLVPVNLRSGEDRLAIHLSYKLSRLTGRWPPPEGGQSSAS
jgi:hypothetical protein